MAITDGLAKYEHRADGGASTCEESHGTEGGIMKLSVASAVLGLIVATALGVAAATGSAKMNPLHVSVIGGGHHYGLVPVR